MNCIKSLSLWCLLLCLGLQTQAQSFLKSNLSFLKGETQFKFDFVYDPMKVGKKNESDYIAEKVSHFNGKQRGKGDQWLKIWEGARERYYEPKFAELFNKYASKTKSVFGGADVEDAKYLIRVKTVMTEPGFNVMVHKKPAECLYEIEVVEMASGTVKAKGSMSAKGRMKFESDFDFDPTNNIAECYAKAGKEIGAHLAKFLK